MQRPLDLIKSLKIVMMLLFRKTSETTRAECCALALLARDGNLKAKQTLASCVQRKCSGVDEMFERRGAGRSFWPCNCTGQMRHLQCDNVGLMSQNSLRLHQHYFSPFFFCHGSALALFMASGHVREPAAF